MPTRIKVDLSEEGIQRAIDELEVWEKGTLDAAVDTYALLLVDDVRDTMRSLAEPHIDTSRLYDSITEAEPSKVHGKSTYRLTIDPVDPADEEHYAETERSRSGTRGGTPHDFTAENKDYIDRGGAEYLWNASIKGAL